MPHLPAKRAPRLGGGGGWPARPALFSSQVALEPNPSQGRNATIVLELSHHCQDQLHSTEQPAQTHRCSVPRSPVPFAKILKGLIPSECRALSLLFYPIRCVFFCPRQAQGFNIWDIEFHLLLSPPSPGY